MRMLTHWVGVAAVVGAMAVLPCAAARASVNPCSAPTIVGTGGDDHIVGTEAADVIDALGGDDVVEGLGGDDVLCGGDGGDTLIGGAGNDRLYGQGYVLYFVTGVAVWRPNVLDGGPGDDYVSSGAADILGEFSGSFPSLQIPRYYAQLGGSFLSFQDAPEGVQVDLNSGVATGDGTDTIALEDLGVHSRWNVVGSPYADNLVGDRLGNQLVGGEGDDVLKGGGGVDTLVDAPFYVGFGPDQIVVGGGADVMSGGAGRDDIEGGDGNDRLSGVAGRDSVSGGAGDDSVRGGRDDDRVYGGGGSDVANGGGGADVLTGGPGADTLLDYGGRGADLLKGKGGNDVLINSISASAEHLLGGHGRDMASRAPHDRLEVTMICRSIEVDRTRGACSQETNAARAQFPGQYSLASAPHETPALLSVPSTAHRQIRAHSAAGEGASCLARQDVPHASNEQTSACGCVWRGAT
jgi:Ca2+-binding RTX toxin-like protein